MSKRKTATLWEEVGDGRFEPLITVHEYSFRGAKEYLRRVQDRMGLRFAWYRITSDGKVPKRRGRKTATK